MLTESAREREVHRGKDGWLFLTGGSNQALSFYTEPDTFSDSALQQWLELLQKRRTRCQDLGAEYLNLIVPEKLTIYYDKYNGELPFRLRSPAMRLPAAARSADLADVVVDAVPYFLQQKEQYKLFWHTDTHWTFEGCLCAFQLLCSRLGILVPPAILNGRSGRAMLTLDLGSKLNPPIQEEFEVRSFLSGARRVAANPLVHFKESTEREDDSGLHIGSNVVFCNFSDEAVDRSVIIFGDSFSEYRPHLLTGMFAETFREVHFVWSTSIDWRYVERVKPSLVITEGAERFASQVPSDTFYIDQHVVRVLAPLMGDTAA